LKSEIREIFSDSARVREVFLEKSLDSLIEAVHILVDVLKGGNKILLFGNGGSAADAQHIAAEFVNRYILERPPLPAMALTTDTSVLTAISNDFSYDEIFEKQIKALGKKGDAAVGISTSGKSPNVQRGLKVASDLGLACVGIGGPADSPMKQYCRCYIPVDGGSTPRVQEVHLLVGHTIVEMIDRLLFGTCTGS
jgi:D-sedoheptulose 7-phosphate isomerase